MTRTCACTAATATAGVVETLIGTVTLPSNASRIVGVAVQLSALGLTTLQTMGGIFRVSCNNIDVTPGQFPLPGPVCLGTDMNAKIYAEYPVNWGPSGNSILTFYVTMDTAQGINPTGRGFVFYDK